MKKDRTIKILLAVIAINLYLISLNQFDIFPKAFGNSTSPTNIKPQEFGLVPLNEDGTVSVRIESSDVVDINVHSFKGKDFFEALPVFIMNK